MRSVRNKLHTLRALAPDLSSHDVCCLTETWLTADVADTELQLGWDQHTWFRRDRLTHGGGVACAVRTQLRPIRRQDLEPDAAEVLVVEVGGSRSVYVAVCYRPPDRDCDFSPIFECLAKPCTTGRPVIACGDFNLPEIEWPSDDFPVTPRRSARAVEFLFLYILTVSPNLCTHPREVILRSTWFYPAEAILKPM